MKRDRSPAESPLQIDRGWRAWRGHAFGVGPSALRGTIRVADDLDPDLRAMDEAVLPLWDDDAPALQPTGGAGDAVVERLLAWSVAAQRSQKLPLLGSHRVLSVVRDGHEGKFDVAVPMHAPAAWNESLTWFTAALNALLLGEAPSPQALIESYDAMLRRLAPFALSGTNNFQLVNAAHASGIPSRMVMSGTICFGWGVRSRWMNSTLTDRTPALAAQIAHSKTASAQVLRMHGVPVPEHVLVRDESAAVDAARRLGWPVVIKPDDQEQGRGVAAGLEDETSLRHAYRTAAAMSGTVLVERHHPGRDYRVYVLGDQVVKILLREPGRVEGDGVHNVAELVEIALASPRLRKARRQTGKRLLDIDDEARALLHAQGLAPESVPDAGRHVVLRRKSNISAGGLQTLVLPGAAHPDNLDLAVRATEAVQLDLCGVDMLLPDIARSWRETGGVVIEVNSKPQIGISTAPEVYGIVLRKLVEGDGRVAVNLLVQDTADPQSLLAAASTLGANGMSCPQGVWLDGRCITNAVRDGFDAARMLLLNRRVRSAMCVMSTADVLQHGLPVDRADSIRVTAALPADQLELLAMLARDHCTQPIMLGPAP